MIRYVTQTPVTVDIQYVDNPFEMTVTTDEAMLIPFTGSELDQWNVTFIESDPSETNRSTNWVEAWISVPNKIGNWGVDDYIFVNISTLNLLANEGTFELEYKTTEGAWTTPTTPGIVSVREDIHPRQVRVRLMEILEPDPPQPTTFDFTILIEAVDYTFEIDSFDLPPQEVTPVLSLIETIPYDDNEIRFEYTVQVPDNTGLELTIKLFGGPEGTSEILADDTGSGCFIVAHYDGVWTEIESGIIPEFSVLTYSFTVPGVQGKSIDQLIVKWFNDGLVAEYGEHGSMLITVAELP